MTTSAYRRAHRGPRLTHAQLKLAVITTLTVNAAAVLVSLWAGVR